MCKDQFLHGIDVTSINRPEFKNNDLIKRFLHHKELIFFTNIKIEQEAINFLASRWTIKEAIYKSLDNKIPMDKILIVKDGDQYTYEHPFYFFKISISYISDMVFASVIAWKK
ncbi:MAG: 4'-phosphopantetheinyl transferase superfamily protein [Mycoplasma sp.]